MSPATHAAGAHLAGSVPLARAATVVPARPRVARAMAVNATAPPCARRQGDGTLRREMPFLRFRAGGVPRLLARHRIAAASLP